MNDHLSHAEIERIIDEQERELDLLILESELREAETAHPAPTRERRSAGPPGRLRRTWQSVRRWFSRRKT